MSFKELSLIEPILKALETEGYTQPTPIQEQSIPFILKRQDLLGCAQTGTGKTAAFAIPILQILHADRPATQRPAPIRSLILTPTRELAIQIGESFSAYGKHTGIRNFVVFGGVGQKQQTDALHRGVDVLIATPGRLLDLMQQGFVSLQHVQIFVLDEADRMLDMGFIHDVKRVIAKLPAKRQTLFFSATMPPEISGLADSILTNPAKVAVTPISSTVEKIEQSLYFVDKSNKKSLLIDLLQDKTIISALVFTRTKHGANRVTADLEKAGVAAAAIHGNKSQNARQAALSDFKRGRIRVLVATDIAARGIDVEDLTHVINYELPNIPETYVHRIGRTGRAGASGTAISFCEGEEVPYLRDIQKLIGQQVPVVTEHPYPADLSAPIQPKPAQQRGGGGRQQQSNRPKPQGQPQPGNNRRAESRPSQPRERVAAPARREEGVLESRPSNRNDQSSSNRPPQQRRERSASPARRDEQPWRNKPAQTEAGGQNRRNESAPKPQSKSENGPNARPRNNGNQQQNNNNNRPAANSKPQSDSWDSLSDFQF